VSVHYPPDLASEAEFLEDVLARMRKGEIADKSAFRDCLAILMPQPVEPVALRRKMLRRIWRRWHAGVKRTPAAGLIFDEWVFALAEGGDPLPGTKADAYAALGRAGIAPVARRTIVDDLDDDLHPL
jgi:hypothetical protein